MIITVKEMPAAEKISGEQGQKDAAKKKAVSD